MDGEEQFLLLWLIDGPRYMIRRSSEGFYGGTMIVFDRHFSTPFEHSVPVAAKTELAAQGYKLLMGADLEPAALLTSTYMNILPISESGTKPSAIDTLTSAKTMHLSNSTGGVCISPNTAPKTQQIVRGMREQSAILVPVGSARHAPGESEESYISKLARLAMTHRKGSSIQYDIQKDHQGRGWSGKVTIEAHDFSAPRFFNSAALVKETVAHKAYSFLSRALTARAMVPVLGFGALARARNLLNNQADVFVSGDADLTVNAKDEYGAVIISHKIRIRACGKLSHTLQALYHQNPQWYERQGRTSKGEPMHACLLHWADGKEIFGDICQGYPDPKLARMMAAIPALQWLEDRPDHKQGISRTPTTSLRTVPVSKSRPVVKVEPGLELALPRQAASTSDLNKGHYSSDNDLGRADRYPPNPIDRWHLATGIGKRHAGYGLCEENAPLKKRVRIENDGGVYGSAFPSNRSEELDYGRVEHVDGRYGFGH